MIFINLYNTAPDYYLRTFAIKNIAEKFRFVRVKNIGLSLCSRRITALSVGNERNQVLYAGAFHGMEWINTIILLQFFEEICACYQNREALCGTNIYDSLNCRGLMVIPCVNPDGVEIQIKGSGCCPKYKGLIDSITEDTYHWQANARGVDLNHNFNAGWKNLKRLELSQGISTPSPTRYGGERPFSEPETIALKNLCLKRKFCHVVAFHSQGREVYSTYGNTPEKSVLLGNTFANLSGYKMSVPEKIATGGGFKDWLIGYMKTPAITVETGMGKNPLPLSDAFSEYAIIKNAMVKCLRV